MKKGGLISGGKGKVIGKRVLDVSVSGAPKLEISRRI